MPKTEGSAGWPGCGGCATRFMARRNPADTNRESRQGIDGLEFHPHRDARSVDRRGPRFRRGGAMPLHPGQARARSVLCAPGKGTRRQAKTRVDQRFIEAGIAAGNAARRRRGLQKPAQHLPRLLSYFTAQLPARFSANEARPSEASAVWRRAACMRTRRA